MKVLFYQMTDNLGLLFCESYFQIVNIFYPVGDPNYIVGKFLDGLYWIGTWFYSFNDEVKIRG